MRPEKSGARRDPSRRAPETVSRFLDQPPSTQAQSPSRRRRNTSNHGSTETSETFPTDTVAGGLLHVAAKRVSTRQLIAIGQLWERRRDKATFRVYQVHRKEKEALLLPVAFAGYPRGRDLVRVTLGELRQRFRLLSSSPPSTPHQ